MTVMIVKSDERNDINDKLYACHYNITTLQHD